MVKTNERAADSWAVRDPRGVPDYANRPLGDELDLHSVFQWESFLHQGIDAHFLGRRHLVGESEERANASDFWGRIEGTTDGIFTLATDHRTVSIYSRRAFDYPIFVAYFVLPNLVRVGDEASLIYYFGLEAGANAVNGAAFFRLRTDALVTNELRCKVGSLNSLSDTIIEVNKPADFLTVEHAYRILHSKNLILFTIDHVPALFVIPAMSGVPVEVKENVLPYSIVLTVPIPKSISAFHEIAAYNRTVVAPSDVVVPISPFDMRFADGHEVIPLDLPLYEEDTANLFTTSTITAVEVSLTSHPFPLFGYEGKTVWFRADQDGAFDVEVLLQSGVWRIYNPDAGGHTDSTYVANELMFYEIASEVVLGRIVFEPGAYPCVVSEGEVTLR